MLRTDFTARVAGGVRGVETRTYGRTYVDLDLDLDLAVKSSAVDPWVGWLEPADAVH